MNLSAPGGCLAGLVRMRTLALMPQDRVLADRLIALSGHMHGLFGEGEVPPVAAGDLDDPQAGAQAGQCRDAESG